MHQACGDWFWGNTCDRLHTRPSSLSYTPVLSTFSSHRVELEIVVFSKQYIFSSQSPIQSADIQY